MTEMLDEKLYQAGSEGVVHLEDFVWPLIEAGPSNLSPDEVRAGCIIHSFALVWNTISGNLPVEVGEPRMETLIDTLTENIADFGFDWTRDDIKASVGRIWYEIVQVPGENGPDKLHNISRNFLSYYLQEGPIEPDTITGMVGVIRHIMGGVQVCLEELEVLV